MGCVALPVHPVPIDFLPSEDPEYDFPYKPPAVRRRPVFVPPPFNKENFLSRNLPKCSPPHCIALDLGKKKTQGGSYLRLVF